MCNDVERKCICFLLFHTHFTFKENIVVALINWYKANNLRRLQAVRSADKLPILFLYMGIIPNWAIQIIIIFL